MSELLTGLEEQLSQNRALDLAYAQSMRQMTGSTLEDFIQGQKPLTDLLGSMLRKEVANAGLSANGETG